MSLVTNDYKYGLPDLIVDPTPGRGTHTTWASAFADVTNGQIVGIRAGVYTENATVPDGIVVCALGSGTLGKVKLVGKLTINSAANTLFSNLQFETNSDVIIEITGSGSVQSRWDNCGFVLSDSDLMSVNNPNASPYFHNCFINTTNAGSKLFAITASSQPTFNKCTMTSGVVPGASTLASGTVFIRDCALGANIFSASGGGYRITDCDWDPNGNATFLTTTTAGSHVVTRSSFQSGTSPCFSVGAGTSLDLRDVSIKSTNSNPVTGAGTVTYTPIPFGNTGYGINTTTKTGYNLVANGISFDHGTNLLDDFEEGTYSPSLTGSSTPGSNSYSQRVGRYQRVGNTVHVQILIQSSNDGSGTAQLSLPFTTANNGMRNIGSAVYYNGTNYLPLQSTAGPNAAFATIQETNGTFGAGVNVAVGTRLYQIEITYEV